MCCKACPNWGQRGGLLLGSEEVKKQYRTLEKIIFRKLFPQLMDGVCISQKAEELVAFEAWHAALPAKATCWLTSVLHYVLASPYSLQLLIFNCLLGEVYEWVSTPWLWTTFAAKTSWDLWSCTWNKLTRQENARVCSGYQQSRRELTWDQLLTCSKTSSDKATTHFTH